MTIKPNPGVYWGCWNGWEWARWGRWGDQISEKGAHLLQSSLRTRPDKTGLHLTLVETNPRSWLRHAARCARGASAQSTPWQNAQTVALVTARLNAGDVLMGSTWKLLINSQVRWPNAHLILPLSSPFSSPWPKSSECQVILKSWPR